MIPFAEIAAHKGSLMFSFGIFAAPVSAVLFVYMSVEMEMGFVGKQDVVEVTEPI